jgi:hypothetical protein
MNSDYWEQRIKSYPLPEWKNPPRLFSDKELKEKADRWKKEIIRKSTGKRGSHDSLPIDEWDTRWLAINLFYLADAWVLLGFLFPKKKQSGFFEL